MQTKTIRVLHTDLTVTKQNISIRKGGNVSNAVARVGTDLRANDPTVACIRIDGTKTFQWVGHANNVQMTAVAKSEQYGGW